MSGGSASLAMQADEIKAFNSNGFVTQAVAKELQRTVLQAVHKARPYGLTVHLVSLALEVNGCGVGSKKTLALLEDMQGRELLRVASPNARRRKPDDDGSSRRVTLTPTGLAWLHADTLDSLAVSISTAVRQIGSLPKMARGAGLSNAQLISELAPRVSAAELTAFRRLTSSVRRAKSQPVLKGEPNAA